MLDETLTSALPNINFFISDTELRLIHSLLDYDGNYNREDDDLAVSIDSKIQEALAA